MKGDKLCDEHHVVHYVKPKNVLDTGDIDGSQFILRKRDRNGLSVNWLECFLNCKKLDQIDKIKHSINMSIEKKSCFAEFNVGETKLHMIDKCKNIDFIHDPTTDPSHSLLVGLPHPENSPESAKIGDMLAECVRMIYSN